MAHLFKTNDVFRYGDVNTSKVYSIYAKTLIFSAENMAGTFAMQKFLSFFHQKYKHI